ncbi:PepSY domain-containing protein [Bosea beijingensis]|uniref:PepSY domain-containing protein n=1 Tax=Bosea beijingensis TaxID=3068632 RepID=UPI0027428B57|nr:PepSY domain-containing protein [Bosea sp. REN20]
MVRLLLLLLLLSGALSTSAAALDQNRARAAMERGEIRPLDQVLATARAAIPGDVVALDLKDKKGRWYYKLKILTPAGKRLAMRVDAQSLQILKQEEDDDDDDD